MTKSDLEIWQRYVQTYQTRRIAVLNKVDLLWDDLKSLAEIDVSINRQIDETCRLLELPRDHVIALSAQKALLARIRDDQAMLERSGIRELEELLATRDRSGQAGNPARRGGEGNGQRWWRARCKA